MSTYVRAGDQYTTYAPDYELTGSIHGEIPDQVGNETRRHPRLRVFLILDRIEKTFIIQNSRNVVSRAGVVESVIIVNWQI